MTDPQFHTRPFDGVNSIRITFWFQLSHYICIIFIIVRSGHLQRTESGKVDQKQASHAAMMSEPRNTVRLFTCRISGRIQPFSTHLQTVERCMPSSLAVATTPYRPLGSISGFEVIMTIVLIYSGNCNRHSLTVCLCLVLSMH